MANDTPEQAKKAELLASAADEGLVLNVTDENTIAEIAVAINDARNAQAAKADEPFVEGEGSDDTLEVLGDQNVGPVAPTEVAHDPALDAPSLAELDAAVDVVDASAEGDVPGVNVDSDVVAEEAEAVSEDASAVTDESEPPQPKDDGRTLADLEAEEIAANGHVHEGDVDEVAPPQSTGHEPALEPADQPEPLTAEELATPVETAADFAEVLQAGVCPNPSCAAADFNGEKCTECGFNATASVRPFGNAAPEAVVEEDHSDLPLDQECPNQSCGKPFNGVKCEGCGFNAAASVSQFPAL